VYVTYELLVSADRKLCRTSSPSFQGTGGGGFRKGKLWSLLVVGARSGLYVDEMGARAFPRRSGIDGDLYCEPTSPCGREATVVMPLDLPRGTGPTLTSSFGDMSPGEAAGALWLCWSLGSRSELSRLERRSGKRERLGDSASELATFSALPETACWRKFDADVLRSGMCG
jgi:hypothetical protein